MLNRNYFLIVPFFNKSGEKVIPLLCLYSKQKSRKKNFVIKQKGTQEAILKACVDNSTRNTSTLLVTVTA